MELGDERYNVSRFSHKMYFQDVFRILSSDQYRCRRGDVSMQGTGSLCRINRTTNTELCIETFEYHLLPSMDTLGDEECVFLHAQEIFGGKQDSSFELAANSHSLECLRNYSGKLWNAGWAARSQQVSSWKGVGFYNCFTHRRISALDAQEHCWCWSRKSGHEILISSTRTWNKSCSTSEKETSNVLRHLLFWI